MLPRFFRGISLHCPKYSKKFVSPLSILPRHMATKKNESEDYAKGLVGVKAGKSAIATVGIHHNGLQYRGYDIEDLCQANFEETAYLLLFKELPTAEQLSKFSKAVAAHRDLPYELKVCLENLPAESHPMDILRTACSILGTLEPETPYTELAKVGANKANNANNSSEYTEQQLIAIKLLARFPSALLYWYHYSHSKIRINTVTDATDSVALHFLKLLNIAQGTTEFDPLVIKTIDVSLTLYAEHDFNASTFAARVTAGTQSDLYSCVTTGIGTLKGPLHGGANEAAMEYLLPLKNTKEAEKYVESVFQQKKLLFGFGHRLYKHGDPRSPIIQKYSRELSERKGGEKQLYAVSEFIEKTLKEKKNMYPNLDFYSASAYHQCGVPISFFTPIFVFSRTMGWIAHVLEQREENKLLRPESHYVGPSPRKWVPLAQRGKAKL